MFLTKVVASQLLFALVLITSTSITFADEFVSPSTEYGPEQVVKLQLSSLMDNDSPYPDAGVEQTFAFAHPDNLKITGPVGRFAKMMRMPAYEQLLNHRSHEIKLFSENAQLAMFAVKVMDQDGGLVGFQWVVGKGDTPQCEGCWLTIQVSPAVSLGQSI